MQEMRQGGASPALAMPMSIARLARGGAIAGAIKLASAGLSFLMFLAVALVTDERQFGLYSATYAGASLVSFFASVGQQSAVLRFWPQYASVNAVGTAQAYMARSILVTAAGVLASSLLIAAVALLPGASQRTPEWVPLCLGAALLSLALGWSEFSSSALRAKSVLIGALLPRDVIWRGLVILVVLGCYFGHIEVSAVDATLVTAALLLAAVAPQTWSLLRDTIRADKADLSDEERNEFKRATLGLWGVTALPPALGQVSTLLVATLLGPEIAGGVFVADRTTRLVLLALTGINQALAPEISSAYHSGRIAHVQRITSLTAWGSTAIAVLTMIGFALFGDFVLRIFDPAYDTPTMRIVLVIFALGATVSAGCGPIELLLQLSGAQNALFKILVVSNLAGLVVTALATLVFGLIGAALSIAGTVSLWNLAALIYARRRLNINSSLLGVFR